MLLRIEPNGSIPLLAEAWQRAGSMVTGATKFDFLWLQTDEPWEDRLRGSEDLGINRIPGKILLQRASRGGMLTHAATYPQA